MNRIPSILITRCKRAGAALAFRRGRLAGGIVAALLAGGLLIRPAWLVGAESASGPETVAGQPADPAGRQLYLTNCARCHGETGAGDGLDAQRMAPKPRNLAEGVFKFRTTASGTPPTDADLFRTLSTGLPGSRMPDFQRLPEEARRQLVAYLKGLSPLFTEQKPEPVDLGTDPGPEKADLAVGKKVYEQLGCATCHGAAGRGNGSSAATLVDDWGSPIRAADLTQGWNYRGGSAPTEIVARILTGIDGTPMPSYADAISSKEEAWALAYYVRSLQEEPRWSRRVEAVQLEGPLPSGPDDPAWQKAPRADLRLGGAFYRQGKIEPTDVSVISVQAMYNEKEILFRLRWNDPTESRQPPPEGRPAPPDAVMIAFLPERRLKFLTGSLRSWPARPQSDGGQSRPEVEETALDLCRWSAESGAAREAVLKHLEPLESGGAGVPLESQAAYEEGRWTLVLRRPRQGAAESGVGLKRQSPVLMALAVWDGGNQEQGRRRANSHWVELVLK